MSGIAALAASSSVTNDAALEYDKVGFRAGGRAILQDVSIAAKAGEVLCLLGPSGSGKTTLLRIAAGIERQTEGSVRLGGAEISGPSGFMPPERREIGLMFQDFALFPHMSLIDNVRFGLRGRRAVDARSTALAALRRVGLDGVADAFPHTLSGGEQQRVALARALAPRPQVLLMDEPFSGLDSRLKDSVRADTLRVLEETGSTAIIVTHDPEEAMRMGDRIALLREGRLVQCGPPQDLYHRPVDLFAAGFFSELNVFNGIVKAGKVETPLGIVADSTLSSGTKMVVGLRLSGLRIKRPSGGVEAEVLSRRFLGGIELLTLRVEGVERPLRARVRAGELSRDVEKSFVVIDPKEVFVFQSTTETV